MLDTVNAHDYMFWLTRYNGCALCIIVFCDGYMLLITTALLKSSVVTMVCVVQECHVHYERKQAYVIIDLQSLVYVLYTIYTVPLLMPYITVILVRCTYSCYTFLL